MQKVTAFKNEMLNAGFRHVQHKRRVVHIHLDPEIDRTLAVLIEDLKSAFQSEQVIP